MNRGREGNFQQSFLLCGLDGGFLCGILCFFLFASGIDDNDKPEGGISDAQGCVRKAAFLPVGYFDVHQSGDIISRISMILIR